MSAQSILQQAALFREPGLPASVTQPQALARSPSALSSAQVTSSSSHPPRTLKSAFRINVSSPQATSSHPPRTTLKSAFRIAPLQVSQWSREVSLLEYKFTRSTANYKPTGDVEILRLDNLETIEIAKDWLNGETLSKEKKHYETGYIGCGFTKRGIYVSFLRTLQISLYNQTDFFC